MYPFQGEHYQSVREEAIAFIKDNMADLDGIMLFSLFDESKIEKDIVQTKKASKFYNLHLTQDPSLARKKPKNTKSIAQILGKDHSDKSKVSKQQEVLQTYNYSNRKMVYNCLGQLELKRHVPTPTSSEFQFNDLGSLMRLNRSLGKKTVFFSSSGDFFRVLEGVTVGSQVFEAGFAFEMSKKKRAILVDMKRWALLVLLLVRRANWSGPEDTGAFIADFVRSLDKENNGELFAKLQPKSSARDEDDAQLTKRSNVAFSNGEATQEPPTLKQILGLLNSVEPVISLSNECTFLNF